MLQRIQPPLRLKWSYPGAVASARVFQDVVVTHRDRPWCLIGLHPDKGSEMWRTPGRFVWNRLDQEILGVRSIEEGKSEKCDAVAIDAASGRILRHRRAAFWPYLIPSAANWYIGNPLGDKHGSAVARVSLEPTTGTSWLVDFAPSKPILECAADVSRVFVVVDDELMALGAEDGCLCWRTSPEKLDGPAGWRKWRPDATAQQIVVNTARGTAALDAASGAVSWHQPVKGSRALAGNRVYIHGSNPRAKGTVHTLWALDLKTGKVLLETDVTPFLEKVARGNRFVGPPAVTDTHLFLADDCGTLWALERDRGEPVWSHRPKGILGYVGGTRPIVHGKRLCVTSFNMDPRPPARLYCYEQVESRSSAVEVTGAEEKPLDATLAFEIERVLQRRQLTRRLPFHAARGEWTVLECRVSEGSFFLAVRGKSRGRLAAPLDSGEGAIWVPSIADGDALLTAARKAFGSRSKARKARRVRAPDVLDVTLLEDAGKKNAWVHTKWFGKEGSPEFYVRWSEKEMRGEVREKDETYRRDLMRLLASLILRE